MSSKDNNTDDLPSLAPTVSQAETLLDQASTSNATAQQSSSPSKSNGGTITKTTTKLSHLKDTLRNVSNGIFSLGTVAFPEMKDDPAAKTESKCNQRVREVPRWPEGEGANEA